MTGKKYRYDKVVLAHYSDEARTHGLDTSSTMPDEIVRRRELDAIIQYVDHLSTQLVRSPKILEVGCGNGYTLACIRERFPNIRLFGIDYSPEMVKLAQSRNIPDCAISYGDVRKLEFNQAHFDFLISDRCIINLLERNEQLRALQEIARVTRSGGYLLVIEAFTDAFENLNRARVELGLTPIEMPYYNLWLDKTWFLNAIGEYFKVLSPLEVGNRNLPDYNFLSSHYFVSRVIHACVTKGQQIRNTEFVKFFSFLPPYGNYAPVQLLLLQRR
jgi:ubiquinone/menaquinone biosynthesis C-methylase UbiE